MLLGYARGSVGDVTFAKIKGQQIARARNRNPHNPKTNKQSLQRAIFAAAVKFYTRGRQAFFRFAFEGKRSVESDYNAFMRENTRRAMPVSREGFNNYAYPVVAPFIMSKGTLQPISTEVAEGKVLVSLGITAPETLPTTVGALSEVLISSGAFEAGDILTLVAVNSSYSGTFPSAAADGDGRPTWTIKQMIVDASATTTLASALGLAAASADGLLTLTDASGVTILSGTYAGFAFVHTRPSDSGLRASTQELSLNAAAVTAYEASQADSFKSAVIASWQAEGSVDAQPEAILQGSIAYGQE